MFCMLINSNQNILYKMLGNPKQRHNIRRVKINSGSSIYQIWQKNKEIRRRKTEVEDRKLKELIAGHSFKFKYKKLLHGDFKRLSEENDDFMNKYLIYRKKTIPFSINEDSTTSKFNICSMDENNSTNIFTPIKKNKHFRMLSLCNLRSENREAPRLLFTRLPSLEITIKKAKIENTGNKGKLKLSLSGSFKSSILVAHN